MDLNEDTLADTFARSHTGKLAWVAQERKWFTRQGDAWTVDETLAEVLNAIRVHIRGETGRNATAFLNSNYPSREIDQVRRQILSAQTVFGVESLARHDPRLAFAAAADLPSTATKSPPRLPAELIDATPKTNLYGGPLGTNTSAPVDIYNPTGVNAYGQPTT